MSPWITNSSLFFVSGKLSCLNISNMLSFAFLWCDGSFVSLVQLFRLMGFCDSGWTTLGIFLDGRSLREPFFGGPYGDKRFLFRMLLVLTLSLRQFLSIIIYKKHSICTFLKITWQSWHVSLRCIRRSSDEQFRLTVCCHIVGHTFR